MSVEYQNDEDSLFVEPPAWAIESDDFTPVERYRCALFWCGVILLDESAESDSECNRFPAGTKDICRSLSQELRLRAFKFSHNCGSSSPSVDTIKASLRNRKVSAEFFEEIAQAAVDFYEQLQAFAGITFDESEGN
jgi:hypothetical protein